MESKRAGDNDKDRGPLIFPLNIRLVGKQGRGNTDKPAYFVSMLKEVFEFFDAAGVNLRVYRITFDSWYGSQKLIEIFRVQGFESIVIHGNTNSDNKSHIR